MGKVIKKRYYQDFSASACFIKMFKDSIKKQRDTGENDMSISLEQKIKAYTAHKLYYERERLKAMDRRTEIPL